MKHILPAFLFSIVLFSFRLAHAQTISGDTLKIMSYNTNNYGFPATPDCPDLITDNKHGYMRTIVGYFNPDILGIVKVDATPSTFTTDSIPDFVLDSVCPGCYAHTPYTKLSTYTKENMVYYKTAKLQWVSSTPVYTSDPNIADISLHRFYCRSLNLAITHDTIFLNILLVHLVAGSTSESERGTEMAGVMSWLTSHVTQSGNYIIMGDFNTQSYYEPCYLDMVMASDTNVRFYDCVDSPGTWADSSYLFPNFLTQSTRETDIGDCGSSGGMTNWYDHILCTHPMLNDSNNISYMQGSWHPLGQDGKHTYYGITTTPADTVVPTPVLSALYYMSEHLPVVALFRTNAPLPNSVQNIIATNNINIFPNPVNDVVNVTFSNMPEQSYHVSVLNILGQMVWQGEAKNMSSVFQVPVSSLPGGMYLLRFTGYNTLFTRSFIK